ncbi:basic helix loop helix (BHLH) DNA-binding family protein [Medicago truncatula]|uniref:Basic helix loop helix (BHLH) DNA-binding family protein n=1 Tax=Medicago truncatula TaxID=3880 RepID=A0A072VRG5_MEDTR|nr:basic helix loop helix (BHLH) DNA-binding family protein [Medicago truncatula]
MDSGEQSCEEWSSLSGFYTAEEADFMGQLLNNFQVSEHHYGNFNLEIPSTSWPGHESKIVSMNSSSHFPQNADNSNTDVFSFLQSSSISDTSNIFHNTNGGNICLNDHVANIGYMNANISTYSVQGNDSQQITENTSEEFGQDVSESAKEAIKNNLEKSGKRSRSSMKVQKNKRNVKSRKKPKSAFKSNADEDESHDLQEQNLSSEDDDFNASQKLNAGTSSILNQNDSPDLKLKGKSRCNGGSASDPQGVYAKKRRERINERLKILQSLVPNGTKHHA